MVSPNIILALRWAIVAHWLLLYDLIYSLFRQIVAKMRCGNLLLCFLFLQKQMLKKNRFILDYDLRHCFSRPCVYFPTVKWCFSKNEPGIKAPQTKRFSSSAWSATGGRSRRTSKGEEIWATTCDFQQCGILTSVDSDEPACYPIKLRNSKWCQSVA